MSPWRGGDPGVAIANLSTARLGPAARSRSGCRAVGPVTVLSWLLPVRFDAVDGHVGRDCVEPVRGHRTVHPLGVHAQLVKLFGSRPLQGRTGDQHIAFVGTLHHPGRDVDVDAEPVRSDTLRPPDVDADPHCRGISPTSMFFSAGRFSVLVAPCTPLQRR